jgi:hypothetical protein
MHNNEWGGEFQVVPPHELLHLSHKEIITKFDKVLVLELHYQKMYARKTKEKIEALEELKI